MKRARITAVLAGALAAAAIAQGTSQVGTLSGVVLDAVTEKPIADVSVSAHSAALVGEQTVLTDDKGFFEITMVPPGVYGLTIKKDGYQNYSPEGIDFKGHRLRLKLLIAPGETPEPVAPPAAPPPPPAPEFDAATMTAPVMVSGAAPAYTQDALDRGVEGNMVIRCVVTAEGSVKLCKVQKGLPFMNGACVAALEGRKYKPATKEGKPLDVMYTFNIKLKLPQ